jgi:rare lipoprotein A (peptidoglycan hydrolase)
MNSTTLSRACAVLLFSALFYAGGLTQTRGPDASIADAAATPYENHWLGARDLRLGDRGTDVKTLNWALRSVRLGTPYGGGFGTQTDSAVRVLQRSAGVRANGVVARSTRKALATRMIHQRATWYGPGLYGNRTACGKTLTKRTIGVAHRSLPCGTRVAFAYKGRWLRAKVIDRGPYRNGYRWDLTAKLAKQLGVTRVGTATLKAGVAP